MVPYKHRVQAYLTKSVDSLFRTIQFSNGVVRAMDRVVISDLKNVSDTAPGDGDVLEWSAAQGKWVPGPGGGGVIPTLQQVMDQGATYSGTNNFTFKTAPSTGTNSAFIATYGNKEIVVISNDAGKQSELNLQGTMAYISRFTPSTANPNARQKISFTGIIPANYKMEVEDIANFKGLEYAGPYKANFTQYSLVDKDYVDTEISSIGTPTLQQVLDQGSTANLASGLFRVQMDDTATRYSYIKAYDYIVELYGQYDATRFSLMKVEYDIASIIARNSFGTSEITTNGSNITLNTNSGVGAIRFEDGSHGTAGQVWTSADTAGGGTWAALPTVPTVGSDNQIPYSNSGGTDFDYTSNFLFNGTELSIGQGSFNNGSVVNVNNNGANRGTVIGSYDVTTTSSYGFQIVNNGTASNGYKAGILANITNKGSNPSGSYGAIIKARDSITAFAEGTPNFVGGHFVASMSSNDAYGLYVDARQSNSGENVGVYIETANAGAGSSTAIQIVDGNEGTIGHVLASTDVNGRGAWTAITTSMISDLGTYALVDTYTPDYIPRWNKTTNTLETGSIQDDGDRIAIGTTPFSSAMLRVQATTSTASSEAIKAAFASGSTGGYSGIFSETFAGSTTTASAHVDAVQGRIDYTGLPTDGVHSAIRGVLGAEEVAPTGHQQAAYWGTVKTQQPSANVYGINIEHLEIQAGDTISNNVYGLHLQGWTGSGTVSGTKYGIYQAGASDKNYFAGITQITHSTNSGSPVKPLEVTASNTGVGNIHVISGTSNGTNDALANEVIFYSGGVTAGVQNNSYGLYLSAHASGTNKWGIYQAGANDKNYFAGQLQLNHTAGTAGQFLKAVDAAGNAEWADISAVTATSGSTNQIAVFDGTDSINGDANFVWNNGLDIIATELKGIDLTHNPSGTGTAIGHNMDLTGNASTTNGYGFYSKVNTSLGGSAYGGWFRVLGSNASAFGSYGSVEGSVGSAAYGAYNLVSIGGTNTSGGSMYGSQNIITISTSGTHGASMFGSSVDLNYNKVGGSITNAFGFYSTGIVCNDSGATIENAYGIYLGDNAGDGTINNSYGVYQVGADDKNYLAGQLRLGHTAGTAGQFLKAVDVDGNAEWDDAVTATSGAATQVAVFDGTDSIAGNSNFTWDGSKLAVSGNLEVTGQAYSPTHTLTAGATVTPDFDNGNVQTVTLDQATTLGNPTNLKDGATYIVIVKQPAAANYTLAFDTAYMFEGGTDPTITAANGAIDVLTFVSDGTNLYGAAALNFS